MGHGLGVAPAFVIIKCLSVDAWQVFPTGATRLVLNSNASDYGNHPITKGATTITLPSSVDNAWNANGVNYVMYTFADVKGFSKFGSYVGTGSSTETPFIYTGFKPAFVIIKNASSTQSWYMYDNARNPTNDMGKTLWSDLSDAEYDYSVNPSNLDMLSNGFKLRVAGAMNLSGQNITYMCFAENPLVGTNGIPATAR